MKRTRRNIGIETGTLIIIILSLAFASAGPVQLLCLERGQQVRFSECNPLIRDKTCTSNYGCQFCVTIATSGAYCPANINACNSNQLTCISSVDQNPDVNPPTITLYTPLNDEVYSAKSMFLNLETNENVDLSIRDNTAPEEKWKSLCELCTSYTKKQTFREGRNDITLRAIDLADHITETTVVFYIDSKKPKISKTEPKKGFTSGTFSAIFSEENPTQLMLTYGNFFQGIQSYTFDLINECVLTKNKYQCETTIDLLAYNGQTIEYSFSIEDIAGSTHSSKLTQLTVDSTPPIIHSIDYIPVNNIKGKLTIAVTETNLADVSYRDNGLDNLVWKKLCTKLDMNNQCVKQITISRDTIDIDIQVADEAGNAVAQNFLIP